MSCGPDPAARAGELRELIEYHNKRYFELDEPEIADADFDALVRELRAIEEAHPELRTPDSPTQRVGGAASPLFAPVEHRVPMMSLDNAFSFEELEAWGRRLERPIEATSDFVCEHKIDAVAMGILDESGRFVRAGTVDIVPVGEDFTENVQTIDAVP